MGILDVPSYSRAAADARFVSEVMPQAFGVAADGVTDDAPAINAALDAARAAGVALYIPAGTYRVRSMINVGGSNVEVYGAGIGKTNITVFGEEAPLNAVFGNYGAVNGLRIHDLSFRGTIDDDVTGPRRGRTSSSNGFNTAIRIFGDLAPGTSTLAQNVDIERVEVHGAHGLPIWLSGIRRCSVEKCIFELTMDMGLTWCDRYSVKDNFSWKSADNGFSISRGCTNGTVAGNVVKDCAFWGVWIAGFKQSGAATDAGPIGFSVTGNTVKRAGFGGICADEAPKNGVIVGNTVDTVFRGPSDQPTNIWGVGIFVGGFPGDNRPAPTDLANNILVEANILIDCARGGIQFLGVKNLDVKVNTIIRPGSQFLANGTTVIAATDIDNNFGISTIGGAQATCTNVTIFGNTIIDDRTTPYCNYAWYTTSTIAPYVSNNREIGTRNSGLLVHDNTTLQVHSGIHTYSGSLKATGGVVAGSNAASGTVPGFAMNGAAGSTRAMEWQTASLRRWLMRTNSDAEAGSDAGSRFQIDAYDDAGAFKKSMVTLTRDGKLSFNGVTPVVQPVLSAVATDAATTQALANSLRAALVALGLAV